MPGMSWMWLLLLPVGLLVATNLFIRRSLAPERIPEKTDPGALPWRETWLATKNGKRLFSWFVPARERGPALLIMHGWGGNAEMMLPLVEPLHAAGYGLLLVDARCHGRSDADSFASLPRFAEDIEAGLDWLAGQPDVDPETLGVVGHSVGAGAALLVASRRPTLQVVVSIAAFSHPATMMRRWMTFKGIPFWPVGAYMLAYIQWVIGYRFDDIAPRRTIGAVSCPVLIVHGQDDETVPASEAEEIFAARAGEQVELLLIPGSHDDYGDIGRQLDVVRHFLDRALGRV